MAERSMSAPLAIIKSNGVSIGRMRTIRCTENQRRQTVKGIGTILGQESVLLDWTGNLNCGAFTVNLKKSIIPGATPRIAQTPQQWEDTMVLLQEGVEIHIMQKVIDTVLPSGLIQPKYETFVVIKAAFCTREDWDISEGQVSGRNADFEYLQPFLFPD